MGQWQHGTGRIWFAHEYTELNYVQALQGIKESEDFH